MKQFFILVLIVTFTSVRLKAQDSFEGVIQFSIEYSITDPSSALTEKMLKDIYGDRAAMYYSDNGNFKFKYLNSRGITIDADADYFFAGKDYLYTTSTSSSKIDSTNVTKELSQLLSFNKLKNERILGKDCDCYEYKAIDRYKESANFTYCFSLESPTIKPERYAIYKHFYLGDFFKISQRPYLKFSYEIEGYMVTFVATKLLEMKIDEELFVIK